MLRRTASSKEGPRGPSPSVLRDYALIADGERGALIDQNGHLMWLCFPRWPDPALFAGLMGSGGVYQIAPKGRSVSGGYYEDGTLIWNSRWITDQGALETREALVYPGDEHRAIILRRVRAVDGPQVVKVVLQPSYDYGRAAPGRWTKEDGAWTCRAATVSVRFVGAPDAVVTKDPSRKEALSLEMVLEHGQNHDLVLELSDDSGNDSTPPPDADQCWERTERAWKEAVPQCTSTSAPRDARLAFAVLRGMTCSRGGAVAAVTTSLPERAESSRNYDYRYCWIRDNCYVGHAGASIEGAETILDDSVRWVTERLVSDGPDTSPAYMYSGDPVPAEAHMGLPGYPGGSDIVGNKVGEQFQLDLFGEALLLLARAASKDRLDAEGWRAAKIAFEAIDQHWHEPEAGIWEVSPGIWTHSRLICAAGLRAICSAGAPGSWTAPALSLADRLLSEADRTGLHASGRWQRAPDDDRVDASLLLAEIRGAVPPRDPRSIATRWAVREELSEDGYIYRYQISGKPLGEAEGAFLICNFWMALACTAAGEEAEAIRWFERARAACGSPGLFSEEYDVAQRQLRGNLPQAFVHALLIEASAGRTSQVPFLT